MGGAPLQSSFCPPVPAMTVCSWGSIRLKSRSVRLDSWGKESSPSPAIFQSATWTAKACGDLLWDIMADLIRMEKSVMPRGQWFTSFIVSLEQDVEDYAGDKSHLGKRRVLVNWSPIGDFPLNNTFTFIFTWCIYLVILMGLKVIKKTMHLLSKKEVN